VLLDIFEHQVDPKTRMEVLDNVETLLLYMLTAGDFRAVAWYCAKHGPRTTVLRRSRTSSARGWRSSPIA